MDAALTALSGYTNPLREWLPYLAFLSGSAAFFCIALSLHRKSANLAPLRSLRITAILTTTLMIASVVTFVTLGSQPDEEKERLLATAQQAMAQEYGVTISRDSLSSALSYSDILIKVEGDYVNVRLRESDGIWLFYDEGSGAILQKPQR